VNNLAALLHQGPVIRTLAATGLRAMRPRPTTPVTVPSTVIRQTVPPRPPELVRDFVRHCGGDPAAWRGTVPPHLFPQWGFPLQAETLRDVPYDLRKVLNGGCRLEVVAPLPEGEPLQLEAWLDHVDDNGSRAVLRQRLRTTTASGGCLEATMFAIVPLARGSGKKEKPSVSASARTIGSARVRPADARRFAALTGDVNPVHWLPAYARAAGFRSTILHGFSTLGRTVEALVRARLAGDGNALRAIDVQFVRPVVLPARLGFFVDGDAVSCGSAPGGPAYLTGTWSA
jgi:hypothetical protein